MRYQGSKRSLFKDYYPVISQYRQPGQVWVEPFMGGANSIDKVPGPRIGNDMHPHLVAMWRALQDGWQPPEEMTEFEYNRVKRMALQGHAPDPYLGFVGFGCAYGGIWFDTYARNDEDNNYVQQSRNSVLSQIKTMPKNEVMFFHGSYDEIPLPPNSFIYCDPPYADTAGYSVGGFDHRKFWKWANSKIAQGHTVFVSEYNAPPDWVAIWQKKVAVGIDASKSRSTIEKVFTRAMTYDEEAAREYYNPPLHKMYSLKQVLHFLAPACRADDSHLVIDNLRATASTRTLTVSAPINIPHDVKPHAVTLAKAVKVADDIKHPVATSITKAGKLAFKAGTFKSYIECVTDHELVQTIKPTGETVPNAAALYNAFKTLLPFVSDDPLRKYLHGIYVGDKSCLAVSNAIFCEYWTGIPNNKPVIVPLDFAQMVVNLNEEPESIQVSDNTMTFWYPGERRYTTTLMDAEWPVARIREVLGKPVNTVELSDSFFEAIYSLKKFSDDNEALYIYPDYIATDDEEEVGTRVDVATGAQSRVIMSTMLIAKLEGAATHIDWSTYPQPCGFRGERLRGAIMGRTV